MNGIVQISTLGKNGRFGNQLFQWAFARAYADLVGAELETSAWDGWRIFPFVRANSRPISKPMKRLAPDQIPQGETDIDLYGYFQNQQAVNLLSRTKLREWFKIGSDAEETASPGIKCGRYCAWHLRLEDYVTNPHFAKTYMNITTGSYLEAMLTYGIHDPVITVSADFTRGWLTDFLVLRNANVLFRANSSFSWWAGVLGDAEVFSPLIDDRVGWQDTTFVRGNHPRMVNLPNVTDLHLPD